METMMKTDILNMLKEIRPEFDFEDSDDFVMDGLLDSFDIITLCSMLEERYGIMIDGLDIVPENFASLGTIEALVQKSGARK